MSPTSPTEQPPRTRTPLLTTVIIITLFSCMSCVFLLPWFPYIDPGVEALDRFMPLQHGQTVLFEIRDRENNLIGWETRNYDQLPSVAAFDRIGGADTNVLIREAAAVIAVTERRVFLNQVLDESRQTYLIRTEAGDYTVSDSSNPMPIQVVDTGQFPTGRLTDIARWEPLESIEVLGRLYTDCVTHTQESEVETAQKIYCADVGLVKVDLFDKSGMLVETLSAISGTLIDPIDTPNWPAVQSVQNVPSEEPINIEQFEIEYHASLQSRFGYTNAEAGVPTVFVAANRPFVVSSRVGGVIEAISAETGESLWTYQTGGSVYGGIQVDEANRRLYFGASDKRLYAIDLNGMYLWSILTQDNVVTRPIVVQDRVLFGSEDGFIYCADLNGNVVASTETNGAVTAWPATDGRVALFGSDDGGVYAITPADCQVEWVFDAGNGVEAGILIDVNSPEVAYVTGRNLLAAVDLQDGNPIWTHESEEVLRSMPGLGADRLFVIDRQQNLTAFNRSTGRVEWINAESDYLGTPLVLGPHLIVGGEDDMVYLLDQAGTEIGQWAVTAPAETGTGDPARFMFGPQSGGEHVWLIDTQARIFKLSDTE